MAPVYRRPRPGRRMASQLSSGDLLADRRYRYAEACLAEGDPSGRRPCRAGPGDRPRYAPAWLLLGRAREGLAAGADPAALGAAARAYAAPRLRPRRHAGRAPPPGPPGRRRRPPRPLSCPCPSPVRRLRTALRAPVVDVWAMSARARSRRPAAGPGELHGRPRPRMRHRPDGRRPARPDQPSRRDRSVAGMLARARAKSWQGRPLYDRLIAGDLTDVLSETPLGLRRSLPGRRRPDLRGDLDPLLDQPGPATLGGSQPSRFSRTTASGRSSARTDATPTPTPTSPRPPRVPDWTSWPCVPPPSGTRAAGRCRAASLCCAAQRHETAGLFVHCQSAATGAAARSGDQHGGLRQQDGRRGLGAEARTACRQVVSGRSPNPYPLRDRTGRPRGLRRFRSGSWNSRSCSCRSCPGTHALRRSRRLPMATGRTSPVSPAPSASSASAPSWAR